MDERETGERETGERQWYWCFDHDRAERESACRADRRLGPYPTRAAAEAWRERVESRNDRWDAADRRWKGDQRR